MLHEQLMTSEVMLLDYRPTTSYNRSHIDGALNLTLPGLLLRRLRKGNVAFKCLIHGDEAKEKFARTCKNVPVVLYDENSSDVNANVESPFVLLLKRLKDAGYRVSYLQGGFEKFKHLYPELCETLDDGSDSEHSLPDLGFDKLKIDNSSTTEAETPLDNHLPVEILPGLFLGSKVDSENLELLSKIGVRYILNVTPNIPNCLENNGFRYMQIPISDHWSQNLAAFFPQAIEFIDNARNQKCGVLVHCLAGVSRSVTVTVAYLMQKLCLSLNDAYDFVKKRKSNISPNFNFMGQLLDFEQQLTNSPCRTGVCRCLAEGRRCLSPDPEWMSCEPTPSTGESSDSGSSSGTGEGTGKKQVFHFTDFSEVQKDLPIYHYSSETKPCSTTTTTTTTEFALPMTTASSS